MALLKVAQLSCPEIGVQAPLQIFRKGVHVVWGAHRVVHGLAGQIK